MKKLKIGIVCYPTVGGSGVLATELGVFLADLGHEVHFISSSLPFRLNMRHPNIYFHEAEANQHSVFQYPPYSLTLASKIAEVALDAKLDIVHAHYAVPHAVCAILAKQMIEYEHDFKIITTLHGTDITTLGNDASFHKVIKFGIEKSDAVTAVSDSLVAQTKVAFNPNKKIHRIYNFVPNGFVKTKSSIKCELNIAENTKVVMHISNFRPVKRIENIVKAFAHANNTVDSVLILIGDGPVWCNIKNLVNELKISDKVLMLGKQDNLAEFLSIADVLLLLSEKESFGLVLLEAMACGVPCIGSDVGGIPEVITNNENGFIVGLDDLNATSAKLIEILSNEKLHAIFAKNAIKTVHNRFNVDLIVSKYEELYYLLVNDVVHS